MRFGKHEIGVGHPTFVIAELGVNHNGDLDTALRMVQAAKHSGADAVKIQAFSAEHFCGPDATYQGESQIDLFNRYALSDEDTRHIARECDNLEITFFGTPDCLTHARLLLDCGAPGLKIGSDDLVHTPLLRQIKALRHPVILSTGMASPGEIYAAAEIWQPYGKLANPLALLACTSLYPTPIDKAGLWRIENLKACYPGAVVGYSDHTDSIYVPSWAVAAGAQIIEKHFTLDRDDKRGPDHVFSADPFAFREMVLSIRETEQACGYSFRSGLQSDAGSNAPMGYTGPDAETRPIARRSIVAARDLRVGEHIRAEDLVYLRPGLGLLPSMSDKLIGKMLTRDVYAGARLAMEDVWRA